MIDLSSQLLETDVVAQQRRTLHVVDWNILLDRPHNDYPGADEQIDRADLITDRLLSLGVPLGLVACLEAEEHPEHGHIGKRIARETTGAEGFWVPHPGVLEQIGQFGRALTQEPEVIEISGGRHVLLSEVEGIAFVALHFTDGTSPSRFRLRRKQAEDVIDITDSYDAVIAAGDFNDLHVSAPRRRLMRGKGFRSSFTLTGQRQPNTVPTEPYRRLLGPIRRNLARLKMSVDDVQVRGLKVLRARKFDGGRISDHDGVAVEVSLAA